MKPVRPSVAIKAAAFLAAMAVVSFLCFRANTRPSAIPDESPISASAKAKQQTERKQKLRVPRSPSPNDSDDELFRLARELVAQSPEAAVAWAGREPDSAFRERLLFAVLRAWGETHPHAAVDWALAQDSEWRFKRVEAALAGAVAQPAAALQIGKKLLAGDTASANAYCTALIGALNRAGQFETALQLANNAPPDARKEWLTFTFGLWGGQQPDLALKAMASITNAELRTPIFQAAIQGWAGHNPATLAPYAVSLPVGEDRTFAFNQAAENWSQQDPAAFGAWLNTVSLGPEADQAIALLVTRTDGANRTPQVAARWVENIENHTIRILSLEHVLKEWARSDADAARKYSADTKWLSADERAKIQQTIEIAVARRDDPDLR